jgi:short subunit dehydrogenase-like uncharacterized protein
MESLLIYGANGYTGRLVLAAAKAAGLRPTIAGRNPDALAALAEGLPMRVFGLDDPDALRSGLDGIGTVLHCAGPFSRTARPMVEACIAKGAHYLDITGEIAVFELLKRKYDADASAAGVMLLPGVGFDVVPTDCLARHLANVRPDATTLSLAFAGSGGMSHGTATTALENIAEGGAIRADGRIQPVPAAFHTRTFDFGRGPQAAVTIPWGDVSTAFHSTGIPNIRVYMAVPTWVRHMMVASRAFGWFLGSRPVQSILQAGVNAWVDGPDDDARASGGTVVVGEAMSPSGETSVARLRCPEAYALTADAAVHLALKALEGDLSTGFQTPSSAYGADLILEIPGITREDLD